MHDMAAKQSISVLLALADEAGATVEHLAKAIGDSVTGHNIQAAYRTVHRLRANGWHIGNVGGLYKLHPDHAKLIKMATTPREPEWERVPGPCELLQVMENLLSNDPAGEISEDI